MPKLQQSRAQTSDSASRPPCHPQHLTPLCSDRTLSPLFRALAACSRFGQRAVTCEASSNRPRPFDLYEQGAEPKEEGGGALLRQVWHEVSVLSALSIQPRAPFRRRAPRPNPAPQSLPCPRLPLQPCCAPPPALRRTIPPPRLRSCSSTEPAPPRHQPHAPTWNCPMPLSPLSATLRSLPPRSSLRRPSSPASLSLAPPKPSPPPLTAPGARAATPPPPSRRRLSRHARAGRGVRVGVSGGQCQWQASRLPRRTRNLPQPLPLPLRGRRRRGQRQGQG